MMLMKDTEYSVCGREVIDRKNKRRIGIKSYELQLPAELFRLPRRQISTFVTTSGYNERRDKRSPKPGAYIECLKIAKKIDGPISVSSDTSERYQAITNVVPGKSLETL